jgi:flagella basal body P-ring formation protein FlgA
MIRTLLLLAGAIVLARAAAAAETAPAPKLHELVTVASDIVRIGDLVENAGAAASVAVFRAPDLGQTGTVQVARIAEALRPHALNGLDTAGLDEVVVTRLSRAIAGREIVDRLTRAFAGRFGLGDAERLSVTLDREVRVMHVEAWATAELAIARMQVDPRSGRFDVTLELPGSAAARRLPLRFTGAVAETVEAATLTRTIKRGEVIRASDVQIERRPKAEAGGDALAVEQAVGLAATRPLRAGQVMRSADLAYPQVIQRNEIVTILFQAPGITLTVRGKALEAGAVGDIVSVHNAQSNRTVQGTVAGPGRVTVAAAIPFTAAAVVPAADQRPRIQ